jgi:hypothetical protein
MDGFQPGIHPLMSRKVENVCLSGVSFRTRLYQSIDKTQILNTEESVPSYEQRNVKKLLGKPPNTLYFRQTEIRRSQQNYPQDSLLKPSSINTRRMFAAAALFSAAAAIGSDDDVAEASELRWEASPVNKRSGVTVFDAENSGYNVKFVTYLSRFLLNFDENCQRWWYSKASDIPRNLNADQVAQKRCVKIDYYLNLIARPSTTHWRL